MMQETFSFTALLHPDIIYKVKIPKQNTRYIQEMSKKRTCDEPCRYIQDSGEVSTNITETIYENSRSKSDDSFITTSDDNVKKTTAE